MEEEEGGERPEGGWPMEGKMKVKKVFGIGKRINVFDTKVPVPRR